MELNELILIIEKDVLKYIKNYDLNALARFLEGYLTNKQLMQIPLTKQEFSFKLEFSSWLLNYYNESVSNRGWVGLILFYNNGSHKDAINEFFKLYKMWRLEFERGLAQ
jgi:hypothetical protein